MNNSISGQQTTSELERLFVQAYHQSLNSTTPRKQQNILRDLNWRGKAINPFREWLFSFFANHKSHIFVEHHAEFVNMLDADWRKVRDLAKFAHASYQNGATK